MPYTEPPRLCKLCPRLVAMRKRNRAAHPDWFNGAVPSFGKMSARLVIVGLAPGLKGANRTGRPFTGDGAGKWLYAALIKAKLATGTYGARSDDGLTLRHTLICNAVRCVPPENIPNADEVKQCGVFLREQLLAMPRLAVILTLGHVAHNSTVRALGLRPADAPFQHGAVARLAPSVRPLHLISSYHCSQRNFSTKRLTVAMLDGVIRRASTLAQQG